MYLNELKTGLTNISGIGSKRANLLKKIGVSTITDLLTHYPIRYEDRKDFTYFKDFHLNPKMAVKVIITGHSYISSHKGKILKVHIEDKHRYKAYLICFNRNFLEHSLKIGKTVNIYGKFEFKYGELQSSIFDYEPEFTPEEKSNFNKILPVYSTTEGLSNKIIREAISKTIETHLQYLNEEIPENIAKQLNLIDFTEAIKQMHFPDDFEKLELAKKTLIFHELFYLMLTAQYKKNKRISKSITTKTDKAEISTITKLTPSQEKIINSLNFELTEDQKKVLQEINSDLFSDKPMGRLLQGDVGSGKTIVALLAAVAMIDCKVQVAIMVPTELLASQHAETAYKVLKNTDITIALLTGSLKAEQQKETLKKLKDGTIDLVIGTHSLFQNKIEFKNLQFVIIDEQHKFGVNQRKELIQKSQNPNMLVMSATPIPRTLALTLFADLEISTIKQIPKNRKEIITYSAKIGNEKKVYDFIKKELEKGNQAYFVYPLIEDSEQLNLKSALTMAENLQEKIFPEYKIGLLHSKVETQAKKTLMDKFNQGEIDILVATSVVEVGIDNPNATCIVIEHSDRFGLSTLHQMRGRVGRGEKQSYTFLIFNPNLTADAKKRLKIMKESNDGFKIAEEDMKIRGAGEIAGERQSGNISLKVADLSSDGAALALAQKYASQIFSTPEKLQAPEYAQIKYIIEKCPYYSENLFFT